MMAAIARLERDETDAEEVYRSKKLSLAILWDSASRQLPPFNNITDADAYQFDTPPDEAAALVIDLLTRRIIANPQDIAHRVDPRDVLASTVLRHQLRPRL
jgi:hypothetical protein